MFFFDPDNGIEISSTVNKKKFKYVSYRLLSMFWKTGKTLIIYQHSDRNKKSIEKKISCLSESLDCNKNNDIVIVKIKNVKYIIVINKNQHKFRSVLADFMKSNTEYSKYV